MLGLAAGDSAGGAWQLGYSAVTEQATVIAYQLIENGRIDTESLVRSIRELDGSDKEEPVFRAESGHLRAWLDRARVGHPAPDPEPSLDAAYRAVPLGVALRRDPELLCREALVLGRLFHSDTSSTLSGIAVAAAVAASCFGQSGRDLIAGVVEIVEPMAHLIDPSPVTGELIDELRSLGRHVGVSNGAEALARASDGRSPQPWDMVKAGLLLSTLIVERAHVPIEQAAKIGGSPLAATVGGIVGARIGIRAWPWAFANDTWFAEMGRRLVRGPHQIDDLPIPYAVEHHLISGERQGLY